MAYNNYFPMNYPYYQPYSQPSDGGFQQGLPTVQQSANNAHSGIIWVSGEAGAKGYPIAPNQTVQLWDSEAQVIYLKSADGSGLPSIKTLDYTIRDGQPKGNALQGSQQNLDDYVTKDEFEKRISELKKKIMRQVSSDD